MKFNVLLLLVAIFFLMGVVSAIPTNGASSLVSSNNFTCACAGAAGNTWVRFGLDTIAFQAFKTSNTTPVAGAASIRVAGSPLQASTGYLWTCCDSSGCDPIAHAVSTTAMVRVEPVSTLGAGIDNIMGSNFDIPIISATILKPYLWVFYPDENFGITIVMSLLFFTIYLGLWLRTRGVEIAAITGLILASLMMFSNSGLHMGVPPEVQMIGQALAYASVAGLLLSLLRR